VHQFDRQPGERDRPYRKVALAVALVVGALGALVGGAFATFTNTVSSGGQSVSSGTVVVTLGNPTANGHLTVGASGLAPGDTVARAVQLQNTGSLNLASIALKLSAPTTSLLDSDATNGLQVSVQVCPSTSTLTESATAPYTYTCAGPGGGFTSLTLGAAGQTGTSGGACPCTSVPAASLESSSYQLGTVTALTAGKSSNLVVTESFPSGAPGDPSQYTGGSCTGTAGGTATTENMQGCSSVLSYGFTASQRPGSRQ
jgi:hypothetical protein